MPANIEIKARATDWNAQLSRASALADRSETLDQCDRYFQVETGFLKLRDFGGGDGQLIRYHRPDRVAPTKSQYEILPVADILIASRILTDALGLLGVVRKRRVVFHVGQTRVHFDEVKGLGRFIEVEVVLRERQSDQQGEALAGDLMSAIGIETADLLRGAYADMLPVET